MIQAKELRIGNCFKTPIGEIKNVLEVRNETVVYEKYLTVKTPISNHYTSGNYDAEEIVKEFTYSHISPIPLTRELLEKCGFEIRSEEGNLFDIDYTMISMKDGKTLERSFCVALFDSFCVALHCNHLHFRYLHQLQNLYFAVTGEELVITL